MGNQIKAIKDFFVLMAKKRIAITRLLIVLVTLEYVLNFRYHIEHISNNFWICIISIILILSGTMLRSWAAGILMKRQHLVSEGPYSLVRNPLYKGTFWIMIGVGLVLNDGWFWVSVILLILFIYPTTVKREEEILSTKFPAEWKAYTSQVGRFFPKKVALDKIRYKWSFSLWEKNREYFTVTFTLLAVLGILIFCI